VNKLKYGVVRLAADEHEVGPDLTIAMIVSIACQPMIEVAVGQGLSEPGMSPTPSRTCRDSCRAAEIFRAGNPVSGGSRI
jgi:hypothetical protein